MYRIFFVLSLSLSFIACKTGSSLFNKQSLHDEYGKKLTKAGLDQTALGREWFNDAGQALSNPRTISIPYRELGYFSSSKPRAAGFKFSVKQGEKISVRIDKNPTSGFIIFSDLWSFDGQKPELLHSIDTSKNSFEFDVEENGFLLLRLQPELLQSGDYTLTISSGPSLKFPIAGKSGKVGSFWGDQRDAGARSHEGIDIFAAKRTPAIASADGIINSVTENNLGGKVIFLRPSNKNFSIYYAHLDEQLVRPGQRVKIGDTVGLVGNTGNAKYTPAHLHFGIYTTKGPVDPFPFVNPEVRKPSDVRIDSRQLKGYVRSSRSEKSLRDKSGAELKMLSILYPVAATANELVTELPDGSLSTVAVSNTEPVKTIRQVKTKQSLFLLESPIADAPRKQTLESRSTLNIMGYFKDFAFVQSEDGSEGWVPLAQLK